jgi:hypothetical protein
MHQVKPDHKGLHTLLKSVHIAVVDQVNYRGFPTLGLGLWCETVLSTIFQLYQWQSVLLVEETGVPGENLPQVTDKLYHIMLYRVHFVWAGFELTTLVVIGIDYIGSCKSNYHTIATTTTPFPTLKNKVCSSSLWLP